MATVKKITKVISGESFPILVDYAEKDGKGNQIDTYYQQLLESQVNIKSINGTSILGEGDLTLALGTTVEANPTDAATADMTKVKVGSVTYNVTDETKQPILVSGTNIKTINDESILGSGNIVLATAGTTYAFAKTENGYGFTATTDSGAVQTIEFGAAAAKAVVSSIDDSDSLPTSAAVNTAIAAVTADLDSYLTFTDVTI